MWPLTIGTVMPLVYEVPFVSEEGIMNRKVVAGTK